jgi:hypothetical protein
MKRTHAETIADIRAMFYSGMSPQELYERHRQMRIAEHGRPCTECRERVLTTHIDGVCLRCRPSGGRRNK